MSELSDETLTAYSFAQAFIAAVQGRDKTRIKLAKKQLQSALERIKE